MAETMYQKDGVGLAAPQIGILKRLVMIDVGEGLIKLINPVIIEANGEQQGIEGCLSVPGVSGEVIRPQKVRIGAQNEKGEYNHLEGILFIDKMLPDTEALPNDSE